MLDATDFLSDLIPSKIEAGIDDTDPILCAKTLNLPVKSKIKKTCCNSNPGFIKRTQDITLMYSF